jgi:hypothetical protein
VKGAWRPSNDSSECSLGWLFHNSSVCFSSRFCSFGHHMMRDVTILVDCSTETHPARSLVFTSCDFQTVDRTARLDNWSHAWFILMIFSPYFKYEQSGGPDHRRVSAWREWASICHCFLRNNTSQIWINIMRCSASFKLPNSWYTYGHIYTPINNQYIFTQNIP